MKTWLCRQPPGREGEGWCRLAGGPALVELPTASTSDRLVEEVAAPAALKPPAGALQTCFSLMTMALLSLP